MKAQNKTKINRRIENMKRIKASLGAAKFRVVRYLQTDIIPDADGDWCSSYTAYLPYRRS